MTFEKFHEGTPSWPDVKPALHEYQCGQRRHEEKGSQLKFQSLLEYDTVSLNHIQSADSIKTQHHDARQRKAIMIKGNANLTSQ